MSELTQAEALVLVMLEDGGWHQGRHWTEDGAVSSTAAGNLHRRGLVERDGASRTVNPRNPGFRYRITEAGREALAEASRAENPPTR